MKRSLFAELKRRHVYRVAVAYAVVGWLLVEVASQLFPFFRIPYWSIRLLVFIAITGFPIALVLAWAFELTPDGVRRTEPADSPDARPEERHRRIGRTLDYVIIGVLVAALAIMTWQRWRPHDAPTSATGVAPKPPTAIATTLAPAHVVAPAESIAVLPFTNLSNDKSQDYFADGISEDLLNLLTRIPELQVTARTSSFAFKGKDIDIHEIAGKLHVAHVLEGSVQKAGDEIRITVQLVDVASDRQLWSQKYDRKLTGVFKIQDQIAADVVKNLQVKLLSAAPTVRPTDPKAYALYLQARELGHQITAGAFKTSDALYRQALAIDPRYAPAWVGLGTNFINETSIDLLSIHEGFARARDAADKARAIDPDYAPTQALLGAIAMYGDDELASAAKHFQHALALDPTNLDVLGDAAELLANLGRLEEALALRKAIVRHDPVNVSALFRLGVVQSDAGHYDAAIASYSTVLSLSPGRGKAHYEIGMALLLEGDANAALAEIEQEPTSFRTGGLPVVYCALGRKPESDRAFAALIGKYAKTAAYNIAYRYAYCGDADKAFEWLGKAIEYKDPGLTEIATERLFDKIRSDPRWLPFLRKLGKAREQLAKIQFKVTLPEAWQAATNASAASSQALE